MKKSIVFSGLFLCLLSCKKNNESSSNPPSSNNVDSVQIVNEFTFQYNGAPDISEVQMFNNTNQSISYVFEADVNGIYTLEFHGMGAREILQGNIIHPLTNLAEWAIGNRDTFLIKKNGAKYVDLISDNSNNNSGIIVQIPIAGTTEDSIKARTLRYTRPGGKMESLKFSKL